MTNNLSTLGSAALDRLNPHRRSHLPLFTLLLALLITLASLAPQGAVAATEPKQVEQSASYEARAATSSGEVYTSSGQTNKLQASVTALQNCRTAHPGGGCELTHIDDAPISTTSDIKSRIPDKPHPLFLWRYQSDTATVYLAGSVHVLKPGLYPLPDQFMSAFAASDYLSLEIDPSALTPQEMQFKVMQYGMLEEGQTLTSVLDPQAYRQLAEVTAQYGLPIEQLNQFKPAFITQQLAVMALMSAGYDPTQGVEMHFIAQAGERDILELETVDFQLNLLMNQPLNVQQKIVDEMLTQMDDFEPLTATIITAWLSGDDATFEKAFADQSGTSPETREFTRQLMDQRNVGMADKIAGYLSTSGTYFVLVGAGHYVGPNNIIELLNSKSLKGERIHSNHDIAD